MGDLPLSVHKFTGGNTNGMGGLGGCWGVDEDNGSDKGDICEEEEVDTSLLSFSLSLSLSVLRFVVLLSLLLLVLLPLWLVSSLLLLLLL